MPSNCRAFCWRHKTRIRNILVTYPVGAAIGIGLGCWYLNKPFGDAVAFWAVFSIVSITTQLAILWHFRPLTERNSMRVIPTKHFIVVGVLQTALLGAIVGAMLGCVSLAIMLGDGSVGAIFGFVLGGIFGAIGGFPAYRVFKGRNVRDCQTMIATITILLGFPLAVGPWSNPVLLYLGTMGAFFASLGMCICLIPRTPPEIRPDTPDI